METEKICPVCNVTKPMSDFSTKKRECKSCASKRQRQYRLDNPDTIKATKRRYYEQNKERVLAKGKQRYQEKRQYILAQVATYRESRRVQIREWMRQYRKDNPEIHKETHLKSVSKNRDRIRERGNQRSKRPDVLRKKLNNNRLRKARKRELPNTLTSQEWENTIAHFGGCCAACGRPPGLFHRLSLDHWIPLNHPDCPGTTAQNAIPLCCGVDGCNESKQDDDALSWLVGRYGKAQGQAKFNAIETYLKSL